MFCRDTNAFSTTRTKAWRVALRLPFLSASRGTETEMKMVWSESVAEFPGNWDEVLKEHHISQRKEKDEEKYTIRGLNVCLCVCDSVCECV